MTRKWTHLREVSLQLGLKEIFWNKGVSYKGKKKRKESYAGCSGTLSYKLFPG